MGDLKMSGVMAFLKKDISTILNTPIPIPGMATQPRRRVQIRRDQKDKTAPRQSSSQNAIIGDIIDGQTTKFAIAGQDFNISQDAWIVGEVKVGVRAKIKLVPGENDAYSAVSITILG